MPELTNKLTGLAAGARVDVRGEEWIVRRTGGHGTPFEHVAVTGISPLVKDVQATFLAELDGITPLHPEDTTLVADPSPRFRQTRLFLEAVFRRTPPTDRRIHRGHRAAIRENTYQLVPAQKALARHRPRLLMADGVGLGKTIEVGILLSELMARGRADRVLVVALKSVLAQFQGELWHRFGIPLVRLDKKGIEKVQQEIPADKNPLTHYQRVIISIDTLKKDARYRRWLEQAHWDVVVIDECQNVIDKSAAGGTRTQRARLAQLLARNTEGLLLTSATPHDGRSESFASLIELLEPTAIGDRENYTKEEIAPWFVRRFKKDVEEEVGKEFGERQVSLDRIPTSASEEAVLDLLKDASFKTVGRGTKGRGILFRTTLLKSFLSSPQAFQETIDERLKKIEKGQVRGKSEEDLAADQDTLQTLRTAASSITKEDFGKYRALRDHLQDVLGKKKDAARVVVFSERVDTLEWLKAELQKDLKLKAGALALFTGSLSDSEQREKLESFGHADSDLRLLLCSDAASEGVNLHHQCHRLIHFDLPWSLITLEQRNGRIDRFGQKHDPQIKAFLIEPSDAELKGDLRILEVLLDKENEAAKTLGDIGWLMQLHSADREERRIAEGFERHEPAEEVVAAHQETSDEDPTQALSDDWLTEILAAGAEETDLPETAMPLRLFPDDLTYAREAFDQLAAADAAAGQVDWQEDGRSFTLHPTDDLRHRYRLLPPDVAPAPNAPLFLSTDRALVTRSMELRRDARGALSDRIRWELFWEQHPVCHWLDDRVLGVFSRHTAAVLPLPRGLDGAESVFVFQGIVSSQAGRPLVTAFFGIPFTDDRAQAIRPIDELLEATELAEGPSNPGRPLDDALSRPLEALRNAAVTAARSHMHELKTARAAELAEPLRQELRELRNWRDTRLATLQRLREQTRAKAGVAVRARLDALARKEHDVQQTYKARTDSITRHHTADRSVYLRLLTVLVPA